MNCSFFLKNLEKTFLQFDVQKINFVKHIVNLPQHLSEKFIGDNLSIIDIALRNCDLSIIGIAQGFFEDIDYRYRLSTEWFVVPITANSTDRRNLDSFKFEPTLVTRTRYCFVDNQLSCILEWLVLRCWNTFNCLLSN